MKLVYITLYIAALAMLITVFLGGNLSKPFFDNVASSTLNAAGIKKENIDSLDSRIDDAFFKMKLIEFQIEKFRSFLTGSNFDESSFKKESNAVFARNIYNPLINMLNYIYRFVFFLMSLMLFLSGAISHVIYRSMRLRRRVEQLEKSVYG